jgi:hypothetical protein
VLFNETYLPAPRSTPETKPAQARAHRPKGIRSCGHSLKLYIGTIALCGCRRSGNTSCRTEPWLEPNDRVHRFDGLSQSNRCMGDHGDASADPPKASRSFRRASPRISLLVAPPWAKAVRELRRTALVATARFRRRWQVSRFPLVAVTKGGVFSTPTTRSSSQPFRAPSNR